MDDLGVRMSDKVSAEFKEFPVKMSLLNCSLWNSGGCL